jgi:putative sporulation protein YtxC
MLLIQLISPYIFIQRYKGVIWLIEVHFQEKEDARRLHTFLQQQSSAFEPLIHTILHFEDSHIVQCINKDKNSVHHSKKYLLQWLKKSLCQFILTIKLNDWLKHILSTHYYYCDEDEQQQIIDIVHSVLNGKKEELTVFLPQMNIKEHIMFKIDDWFQEHAKFSFDAFVTFRLRSFMNELKKYVELSLDEYKMEQEYQMFIQMLREFLIDRDPKLQQLHLLFSDVTTFYDGEFNEIKRVELAKMVDRKLLINHPVYIDSVTIAPLLSIAPTRIYLYSDERDQPLIRTIQNIFEERVIRHSRDTFFEKRNHYGFSINDRM